MIYRRTEDEMTAYPHEYDFVRREGVAFRFEGMEGEGLVDCSPEEIRSLYQERFEAHAVALRTLALAAGCDYRRVSTAVPYLQTLGGFLVERAG